MVLLSRLYFVRHGRATAGWEDLDAGLDAVGRDQAVAAADRLAPLGPLAVWTSPLRRCQETAAEIAGRWGVAPTIEPGVAELPSPEGYAVRDRVEWLRVAMRGTWGDLDEQYRQFRDDVVATVRTATADTVIASHFIAINAVIGAVLGDDRLVIRSLDNCSVTVFDTTPAGLVLVEGGHEADTLIR